MESSQKKFWLNRRLFLKGTVATAGVVAATSVGFSVWQSRGNSTYEEYLRESRRVLKSANEQSLLLSEIVRYATLAPNSHNTQPWKFEGSDESFAIFPDFARRCPVVDPDDHHLWVSLGCACENAVLTASALGRHTTVTIDRGDPSIRFELEKQTPNQSDLFQAIPVRQTSRCPFDGSSLSNAELQQLKAACRQEDVEVLFFNQPHELQRIKEFVIEGNRRQLKDEAFVRELKHWMRFSYADAVRTGDGLFGKCSNQPVLPAWLASNLIDFVFTVSAETAKYESQLQSSAGVAVFIARDESPANWINLGRCFQRFALQATALNILHSHINQPVEVASIRGEFSQWLGIGERRPDLVIRFGRGQALPFSLRRPVVDVLEIPPGVKT